MQTKINFTIVAAAEWIKIILEAKFMFMKVF